MHNKKSRLADVALLYVLIGAGIGVVQAVSEPAECGPVGERLIDSGAALTVPQLMAWPYHSSWLGPTTSTSISRKRTWA